MGSTFRIAWGARPLLPPRGARKPGPPPGPGGWPKAPEERTLIRAMAPTSSEPRAPATAVARARRPLVVVPTYNEAGNLAALARAVLRAAPEATLLVVDDASPDGTGRLAD